VSVKRGEKLEEELKKKTMRVDSLAAEKVPFTFQGS